MDLHYLRRQLKKRQLQKNYEIKPIGSALKLRRQQLGMTLEEGAEGICSISYLSKLENNQIEPNPEFVELLSERLGLKQQQTFDRDEYEHDLHLITEWMIEQHAFDDQLLEKYLGREDHQAFLMFMLRDSMLGRYQEAEKHYQNIKQFIPHLMQEELSLFIFCIAEILIHQHRYRTAHQFILELPRAHQKNFNHYILSLRLQLLTSFKLHDGPSILAFYHEYLDLTTKESHYHLVQEMRAQHANYLAWSMPLKFLNHWGKQTTARKTYLDYPYALSYYRHQDYHKVIELSKRQESLQGWYILLLLSYEKLHQLDQLSHILDLMIENDLNPSEQTLFEYMKNKHFTTKDILLSYLRREIIDGHLITDDFMIIDYVMKDAQQLFAKSQFYKEANQVMMNYHKQIHHIYNMDIYIKDED